MPDWVLKKYYLKNYHQFISITSDGFPIFMKTVSFIYFLFFGAACDYRTDEIFQFIKLNCKGSPMPAQAMTGMDSLKAFWVNVVIFLKLYWLFEFDWKLTAFYLNDIKIDIKALKVILFDFLFFYLNRV